MSFLTKEQARAPKRRCMSVELHELPAPVLVAEASGLLGLRLRERKVDLGSEEGMVAMVADMVVAGDGTRMFSVEEARVFLEGLSMESAMAMLKALLEMQAPPSSGGAPPVPSQPSTSAA